MFYHIILLYFSPPKSVGGMEVDRRKKIERESKFYGGSQRNGERQVRFLTLFFSISILQNLLKEWRETERTNLTETLNSLEGAGGM